MSKTEAIPSVSSQDFSDIISARPARQGHWSEAALRVLRERYLLRNEAGEVIETPEDMCWRVAVAIAQAEARYASAAGRDEKAVVRAWAERFYDLMIEQKFLPNSPTLMNAGKGNNLQYSACYVLPVGDSMVEIFDAIKNAALIHQSGGGTGFAFSRLRPAGSLVRSSGGKASGPVSFLRVFNAATEAVKQGGTRRGANMGILRVDHPDIEEFITCKLDGSITNFNISVAATDAFMKAVLEDTEYDILAQPGWPDSKGGRYQGGEVLGRKRARDVFQKIVEAAWRTGDPGLVFIDRVNASPANPTPALGQIEATNPCGEQPLLPNEACIAKGTRITTDRGLERIEVLYERQQQGEQVWVATQTDEETAFRPAMVMYTGRKPVFRVTLANGQSIRLTEDHRVLTPQGFKQVRELAVGQDEVVIQSRMTGELRFSADGNEFNTYRMLGWSTGDGWFMEEPTFELTFGPDDELALQTLAPVWQEFTNAITKTQVQRNLVRCVSTQKFAVRQRFLGLGFRPGRGPQKRVPESIFTAPKQFQIAYLQGLFCADGSVSSKKPQLSLSSASLELLRDVQLLLLNLGIYSNIRYYPIKQRGRAQGSLRIYGQGFRRFMALVGLDLSPQKQEKARHCLAVHHRLYSAKPAVTIVSIEPDGEDEVYDIYEPVTHSLIAEGMVIHNCNLGSLNLLKFVKPATAAEPSLYWRPPQRHPRIDWDELERVVRMSVRFLDDVIEVNPYPLPEINESVKGNRRIGLGVMGWADMLFALGIPYDSEEALALAHQVMGFIKEVGHDASAQLAEERGPFPNWPRSIYANDRPLRNATVTTIAPTGTISIIAGASSGIEPIFALAFSHIVGDRHLVFINPVFEQVARERGFYSEELMRKVAETGTLRGIEGVPDDVRRVFVTAHEIAPEWHVRMQGAFQKHTDNGVSKTINLPNSATTEDVAKAFLLAYEVGCLGITVFRDGCKGVQVLHIGTKPTGKGAIEDERQVKEALAKAGAPLQPVSQLAGRPTSDGYYQKKPRPAVLHGSTYRRVTPLGTAYITINTDSSNQPFEVFLNVGKAGSDVAAVSEALGRLISLILRLPSSLSPRERLEEVVEQLVGIGGGRPMGVGPYRVRSLPDAVAQVLSEYLREAPPEGEPDLAQLALPLEQLSRSADLCPECGQATFVFEEGCKKCASCGFSEC